MNWIVPEFKAVYKTIKAIFALYRREGMTKPTIEEHMRLIKVLKEARERAGLSQSDLSRELGYDKSTIHKIESGRREVGLFEFPAIAKACGEDPIKLARLVWK